MLCKYVAFLNRAKLLVIFLSFGFDDDCTMYMEMLVNFLYSKNLPSKCWPTKNQTAKAKGN